jgi:hypothetical protein
LRQQMLNCALHFSGLKILELKLCACVEMFENRILRSAPGQVYFPTYWRAHRRPIISGSQ